MSLETLTPRGSRREPEIAELLDDPIMQLLWRRDGLQLDQVLAVIEAARRGLARDRHAA